MLLTEVWSAYLGWPAGLPSFLCFPLTLHLITPDTSVNFYWFLYWVMWIFVKFFFLSTSNLFLFFFFFLGFTKRNIWQRSRNNIITSLVSPFHVMFNEHAVREHSSWLKCSIFSCKCSLWSGNVANLQFVGITLSKVMMVQWLENMSNIVLFKFIKFSTWRSSSLPV